ncbi:hypothetical protein C8E99_0081 [Citricoccus muralis]|uniref:Uncharacterized protein n=2 Tax=Citricoccus muralis TaxID=169134 RepID=A0A3D9L9F9_9MICC|nr:hypothetical protein C8E99_0081 [Citricoccus muralis]
MLEGIDPWGLTGPEGLNSVAGIFIGAAIILLAIGCAIGLIRWVGGKAASSSESSRKGLHMVAAGVLGAVVLGSIGGAVQWGSTMGTSALMPEAARPGKVVVDRQAPKTTCTSQAVRNFVDESNPPSNEQRYALASRVIGQPIDYRITDEGQQPQMRSLKWYPPGPNCSSENQTAADCTEVEIGIESNGIGFGGVAATDVRKVTVGDGCAA